MTYTQITAEERYMVVLMRKQGDTCREIARMLGRAPSTISREVRRNVWRVDGRSYWAQRAHEYAV